MLVSLQIVLCVISINDANAVHVYLLVTIEAMRLGKLEI